MHHLTPEARREAEETAEEFERETNAAQLEAEAQLLQLKKTEDANIEEAFQHHLKLAGLALKRAELEGQVHAVLRNGFSDWQARRNSHGASTSRLVIAQKLGEEAQRLDREHRSEPGEVPLARFVGQQAKMLRGDR